MNYLPLLGQPLKSTDIIDLLEMYEVDVVYGFDRCYENLPDEYWASIPELGMELRFDEYQTLRTIFLTLEDVDGLPLVVLEESDILSFGSKQEIRDFTAAHEILAQEGEGDFFGNPFDWIKFKEGDHSTHYDFGSGPLTKVTLEYTGPAKPAEQME